MESSDNKENVIGDAPKRKARSDSSSNRNATVLPSNVKTVLRIRGGYNSQDEVAVMDIVPGSKGKEGFRYRGSQFDVDKVLFTNLEQTEVYKNVVGDAVSQCLRGYNFGILAYGQTGSGKTHSISGDDANPGILPQFCDDLFTKIKEKNASEEVYVSVSFFEVYNEKIFDLLGKERKALVVHGGDEVKIIGLTEVGVANRKEMNEWRKIGLQQRSTAATLINQLSSRSHAIFRITIRREFVQQQKVITVSHCFFVDLAGSEKLHSNNIQRQTETMKINQSLLALQRVVDIRASGSQFVNYRDSPLTRVLRPCFAGNSITVLLATISPLEKYSNESLSTLRFVTKAARIEQTPIANEDKQTEEISYLVAENDAYKKELQQLYSTLENMKNASSVDCPKAPCIVWLHDDVSLNLWKTLENGLKVEDIVKDHIVEVIEENENWKIKLIADKAVTLNGKELKFNEKYTVNHGDGIVVEGQIFLAFYLEADANSKTFRTYSDVKVEYVSKRFEIEKEKLRQEALDDLRKEDADVKVQMLQELEQLRSELDELKKREQNAVGSKRRSLTQQREEAERVFQDVNEVHQNVALQVNQTIQKYSEISKSIEETPEEKEKLLQKRAKVEMLNLLLEKASKSAAFIFRVQTVNDEQKVRLFNKKYKMYADISDDDFNNMYDIFADAYQSSMSNVEIIKVVERYIYSGNLIWKNVRGANSHCSSLFQIAVMNSIQDTAWKRKSTVAEVRRTLNSRKSILMQHVGQTEKIEGSDVELLSYFSLYVIQDKTDLQVPEVENEVANLLDLVMEAKKHFVVFSSFETFENAPTIQKKALSLIGLHRSIVVIEKIKSIAAILSKLPSSADTGIDYVYASIYERSQCIRNAIDAWVTCCREGVSSAEHINLMEMEFASIVESLGRISFTLDYRLLPRHNLFETPFKKGIDATIEDYCEDLEEIRKSGISTRKRVQNIIGNIVYTLKQDVANSEVFPQDLIYNLLRHAIFIKEKIRITSDDKLVRLIPRLKELIEDAKKCESQLSISSLDILSTFLPDFSMLVNAAVKPPIVLI